ncbi:hypothetical protein STEG23_008980, partial [Scotinomys teguina]
LWDSILQHHSLQHSHILTPVKADVHFRIDPFCFASPRSLFVPASRTATFDQEWAKSAESEG